MVVKFMDKVKEKIKQLASKYREELSKQMDNRVDEMKSDDNSHYLIYRVLGITESEGALIDVYQNKGRFLYKYAGAFLEEAAFICFKKEFVQAKKTTIENTLGKKPKRFEIDCLIDNDAIEIKWRDATTDGDHITKEHTRIQVIKSYGYRPIRVMFYYPNREQAIRIQNTLKTTYKGVNGLYYSGDDAWKFIKEKTGVDLLMILEEIANEYDRY
jgi:type II restriction enzyme